LASSLAFTSSFRPSRSAWRRGWRRSRARGSPPALPAGVRFLVAGLRGLARHGRRKRDRHGVPESGPDVLALHDPLFRDDRGRSRAGRLIAILVLRRRRGAAGHRRLHRRRLLGLPRQDRRGRWQPLSCLGTPTLTQHPPGRN
jgi:hypothetical protein